MLDILESMAKKYLINVILCVLLSVGDSQNQSAKTCTELELLHIKHSEHQIKVQEKSLFNLTVYLDTVNCHGQWNWSLVKLAVYENVGHVDICKIILDSRRCRVTKWSSPCTCLSDDYVQFYKSVTWKDSKTFIWKWSDSHSWQDEKEIEISLHVEPAADKILPLSRLLTYAVLFACISIIVIAVCFVTQRSRGVRVSSHHTPVRDKEIHMYALFHTGSQGHRDETQNMNLDCRHNAESATLGGTIQRDHQTSCSESREDDDSYIHPV